MSESDERGFFGVPPEWVQEFETPDQRILRGGFEEITARNEQKLRSFDPRGLIPVDAIELHTIFPEYEDAMPHHTAMLRDEMLAKLGLNYTYLQIGHPECFFQYTYRNGTTRQLRRIVRPDDTTVIVDTWTDPDQNPKKIYLLSNGEARDVRDREQERINRLVLSQKIANELGDGEAAADIYDGKLSAAELRTALDELRTHMLSESLKPQDSARLPGWEALDKARQRLTRSMLPAFPGLAGFRERRLAKRREDYTRAFGVVLRHLDQEDAGQFMAAEQNLRLANLNRQLRVHKAVKMIGAAGILGAAFAAGEAGAAALAALSYIPQEATALGLMPGIAIGLQLARQMKRRMGNILGFTTQTTGEPNASLDAQLAAEQERAAKNLHWLHTAFHS